MSKQEINLGQIPSGPGAELPRSLSEKCCFGDCGAGILACKSLKNGEAGAAKDGRTTILRQAPRRRLGSRAARVEGALCAR